MLQRDISRHMVKDSLIAADVIEDYPDDKHFPGALLLGWHASEPLQVVAALDTKEIAAYKPDLEHFMDDYRSRRKYGS